MTRAAKLAVLPLVLGAAVAAQSPQVRFPDPDIGVTTLNARARAQRASVDRFKVVYDFQFTDRVRESGITFVHHVVDDAGVALQARALRPRQRHRRRRRRRRRPAGHLLRQPGRRQPALEESRRRPVRRTSRRTPASRSPTGSASPRPSPTSTTTATRICSSRRCAEATCCSRTTATASSSDISKAAGVDYVGHSSGAVFFDYDNDGLLDLFVCNVGHYTSERAGPRRRVRRPGGRVRRPPPSGPVGDRDPLQEPRRTSGSRTSPQAAGLGDAGWSGDASVADLNGDGFPDLYVLNMQGSEPLLREPGRARRSSTRRRRCFPRTPWGAMGIKFFDYDNDGRPDLLRHRHALGHERRPSGPSARS